MQVSRLWQPTPAACALLHTCSPGKSCLPNGDSFPAQTNRFAIRKNGAGKRAADPAEQGTDYASKLLHLAWHPEANVIAAAASNSLYMYTT
jgi:hypothetical protein